MGTPNVELEVQGLLMLSGGSNKPVQTGNYAKKRSSGRVKRVETLFPALERS